MRKIKFIIVILLLFAALFFYFKGCHNNQTDFVRQPTDVVEDVDSDVDGSAAGALEDAGGVSGDAGGVVGDAGGDSGDQGGAVGDVAGEVKDSDKKVSKLLLDFNQLESNSDKIDFLIEEFSTGFLSKTAEKQRQNFDPNEITTSRLGRCLSVDLADGNAIRELDHLYESALHYASANTSKDVKIYWHAVHNESGEGKLDKATINNQLSVVTKYFEDVGLKFILEDIEYIVNDNWFYSTTDVIHNQMKKSIWDKKANYDLNNYLHIYSIKADSSFAGSSVFPWYFESSTDGIVLNYESLPGGELTDLNKGMTLVHELGHFFGLYHTFHNGNLTIFKCDDVKNYNGCRGSDLCDDTPQQKFCHYSGCGKCNLNQFGEIDGLHTCNSCIEEDDKPDLVSNIMGYNTDDCMQSFTQDQIRRMTKCLFRFRHRSKLIRK